MDPRFQPKPEKKTHSQSWIRITGLPQEYWSPKIIFSIAGRVGIPISLYGATSNRSFGHFAKVLVEIDLKADLPNQIFVEREGFAFLVGIEYENLPQICLGCNAIGHAAYQCRRVSKKSASDEPAKNKQNNQKFTPPNQVKVNDLVIDLDIDNKEDFNLQNLERVEDTPILSNNNNMEVVQETSPESSKQEVNINPHLVSEEEFVVKETSDIANSAAANDLKIVGTLWGEEETDEEDQVEERNFTPVMSRAQKKKLRRKGSQDRIHFTRRGGHAKIYAHTNYIQIRALWLDISSLIQANPGPWCCIGDFNVVLRAHECKGARLPARLPSEEFKTFSDSSELVHLNTSGQFFTWSNRRRSVARIKKRLDRSLCNEEWLNLWSTTSCCTLPRVLSDHHPILLCSDFQTQKRIQSFKFHSMWSSHMDCKRVIADTWNTTIVGCPMFILSQKLKLLKKELKCWNVNIFGNIHANVKKALKAVETIHNADLFATENITLASDLIQSSIPSLVSEADNAMLTNKPCMDEIKKVVFAMKSEGAPGWVLPNMNSNTIILIPKSHGANKIADFRPIALANCQFKIITKVIVDRLSNIAVKIISPQAKRILKG
ncbi:PREDICTED: uncharacterized protein LOC109337510 [Lupinus angustifolius]|uniref:uncharacterized protein LOC109337510 n=1 Tax=Lupinus angustifolius TaxID=3871 RepID=UPI00092F5BBF|nr:PREDICTED: uncharacterized protein LOC109337510 [Lupinus angustifolius]